LNIHNDANKTKYKPIRSMQVVLGNTVVVENNRNIMKQTNEEEKND